MTYYYKDITLLEAVNHISEQAMGNNDWHTTIGSFVGGMVAPNKVKAEEGLITISKDGFQQLVVDRLGYTTSAFNHPGLSDRVKMDMLYDLAESKKDQEIKIRTSNSAKGLMADAILSESYSIYDNRSLSGMLLQLQFHGALPQDTRVMTMALAPGGRYLDLRLRANSWDFEIDERNRLCPFLGNLLITNDERGKGKLEVRTAITRGPCLNTMIGQAVFSQVHRFAGKDDFYTTLGEGISHIGEYSKEMGDRLSRMIDISTDQPLLIFQKIGERLGVPQYALNKAEESWKDEGEEHTLYHIVQAVVRGTQELTFSTNKKRTPKWDDRAKIETDIWDEALMLAQMHEEGLGMDHYLICDSCHQPLPEPEEVL